MKLTERLNNLLEKEYDFNHEDVEKEFSKLGFKNHKMYGFVSPSVRDDNGFHNWYSVVKVLDNPLEVTGYTGTTAYTSKAYTGNTKKFDDIKSAVKYYKGELWN